MENLVAATVVWLEALGIWMKPIYDLIESMIDWLASINVWTELPILLVASLMLLYVTFTVVVFFLKMFFTFIFMVLLWQWTSPFDDILRIVILLILAYPIWWIVSHVLGFVIYKLPRIDPRNITYPPAIDEHGNSALHRAVEGGDAMVIDALLKCGIDPNLRNVDGKTALGLIDETDPLYESDVWQRLYEATHDMNK
jgi:hypothetical protein